MSNFTELYDYTLDGANIEVWPTEEIDMITIVAADFFSWMESRDYVFASATKLPYANSVCLYYDKDENYRIWETWAEWWADPRVISQPGKFSHTTNLVEALLCEYLNDPVNVRYTDCRTVDQLPKQFLTAAEKAAKQ